MTWVLIAAVLLVILAAGLLAYGLCGVSSSADELAGRDLELREGELRRRASR